MAMYIFRCGALAVIAALMLSVCWPCAASAAAVNPCGLYTLDVCSKEKGAVTGADLTISEPLYTIQACCTTDAHYQVPVQYPESVEASPLFRPPAA